MRKLVLVSAGLAAALAAGPALAQSKETRVSTTAPQPQVVERVVVREVPGPERIVTQTVEVEAPARVRTSDAFTGWKVGAQVGVADVDNFENVSYGVIGGYDAPIGDRLVAGADLEFANFAEDHRSVGAGVRLGYAATETVLPFARVGYTKLDLGDNDLNLHGLEVGGGVEIAVSDRITITPEYRYTDFNSNAFNSNAHGVRLGVAFRF